MCARVSLPFGYECLCSVESSMLKVLQEVILNDSDLLGVVQEKAQKKIINYWAAFSLYFLEGAKYTFFKYSFI